VYVITDGNEAKTKRKDVCMFPKLSTITKEFDTYVLLETLYDQHNLKEAAEMLSPFADVNDEVTLRIKIQCYPRQPATYWQPAEGGPELYDMSIVCSDNKTLSVDNQKVIDELAKLFDEDIMEHYEDAMEYCEDLMDEM
jgi:hypothetical protein